MSDTATETLLATEKQVTFAAEKGIEGVTAETPRSEAFDLIGEWIKANPLPADQQRESTADLPPTEAQMNIVSRVTKGRYQPATRKAAGAFIADLKRTPEERAERRAAYRARQEAAAAA
jgi:hypothetical protein